MSKIYLLAEDIVPYCYITGSTPVNSVLSYRNLFGSMESAVFRTLETTGSLQIENQDLDSFTEVDTVVIGNTNLNAGEVIIKFYDNKIDLNLLDTKVAIFGRVLSVYLDTPIISRYITIEWISTNSWVDIGAIKIGKRLELAGKSASVFFSRDSTSTRSFYYSSSRKVQGFGSAKRKLNISFTEFDGNTYESLLKIAYTILYTHTFFISVFPNDSKSIVEKAMEGIFRLRNPNQFPAISYDAYDGFNLQLEVTEEDLITIQRFGGLLTDYLTREGSVHVDMTNNLVGMVTYTSESTLFKPTSSALGVLQQWKYVSYLSAGSIAIGETLNLYTGVTSGSATIRFSKTLSNDKTPENLGTSGEFLANDDIQIQLNGYDMVKGSEVIWVDQYTVSFGLVINTYDTIRAVHKYI